MDNKQLSTTDLISALFCILLVQISTDTLENNETSSDKCGYAHSLYSTISTVLGKLIGTYVLVHK